MADFQFIPRSQGLSTEWHARNFYAQWTGDTTGTEGWGGGGVKLTVAYTDRNE